MKARSIAPLIVGLLAVLALGGSPAGAGTALGPEIHDQAGDAHFVNGGNIEYGFGELGPDTRPASIDSADVRAIWFETAYSTVKDRDEAGAVTAVRHVPTALTVSFRAEEAVSPTFGPAVTFYVPVRVGNCLIDLAAHVGGTDADSAAEIYKYTGCPGGSGIVSHKAFSLKMDGKVVSATFPFSALPYSSTQVVLAKDVVLKPPASGNTGGTQLYVSWANFAVTMVDEVPALAAKFRIGSDVPKNVDCLASPADAACLA